MIVTMKLKQIVKWFNTQHTFTLESWKVDYIATAISADNKDHRSLTHTLIDIIKSRKWIYGNRQFRCINIVITISFRNLWLFHSTRVCVVCSECVYSRTRREIQFLDDKNEQQQQPATTNSAVSRRTPQNTLKYQLQCKHQLKTNSKWEM